LNGKPKMEKELKQYIQKALKELYAIENALIVTEPTKPDFEGDFTFVVFPYLKQSKKGPEQTAQEIGEYLTEQFPLIAAFNVIKGFLNLSISKKYWVDFVQHNYAQQSYGFTEANTKQKVMVEYSSPNTNKPLHLGHVRNNLLGFSVAQILKANGYEVVMCNLVNDRGIHICKSMYAWMQYGNGETPESSGLKGDKLVGKYYVEFDKLSKAFNKKLVEEILTILRPLNQFKYYSDKNIFDFLGLLTFWKLFAENDLFTIKDDAEKIQPELKENSEKWFVELKNKMLQLKLTSVEDEVKNVLGVAIEHIDMELVHLPLRMAQELLRKWEANDTETVSIWKTMNGWVYEGFDVTYKKMGVSFDKFYYESDTYLLGKEIVQEGLAKNVFFKKDDGSVWVDLTADGLDQKLLLRGDGTSVYITQDIGTAELKYNDFGCERSIYVVGNEQDYHFKVLQLICKKLGKSYADGIFHLSYGMVELPHGKMKSREGTVVDADDLMDEMLLAAEETTKALGKTDGLEETELTELYNTIGLGALKYFLLKVDPRKKMMFNPEESIDFQGNTGPFIQYTYARMKSIIRNANVSDIRNTSGVEINNLESNLAQILQRYPDVLTNAANDLSPGLVANYVYDLAKAFSHFYHECPIIKEQDELKRNFRLQLCSLTGHTIKSGFQLLGINVPERM
jgi:arginyl-tRNA synthetase